MGVRGRKSAEQENAVVSVERPNPPSELSPEAAHHWRRIVNSVSADWFEPHHYPTLAAACFHLEDLGEIELKLREARGNPDFDLKDYDTLLKMRDRETKAVNAHMRSMRLTHQATYSARKSVGGQSKQNTWD